jgi:hypothetical protein
MKANQPMVKVISSGKYAPSTLITNEDRKIS